MVRSAYSLINLLTRRALCFALLLLWLAVLPEFAEARNNLLLVFDEDKDWPGLALINQGLQAVFKTEFKADVEFYTESLNLSQFKDHNYQEILSEHFRRKYADKHLDLIIAIMEPSLHFLLRNRDTLFPGVPIVFCGVESSDLVFDMLRANVTGVLVKRTFAPTLEIALRLQPDTRTVFVVGGTSRFDQQLHAIAQRELATFQNRVSVNFLTALSMDDLLKTVSHLPEHSVVLYLTMLADGAGHAFIPHEALSVIAGRANAPVYVSVDQYVGFGAVGGHVYSVATHGRQAAEIGVRILHGEAASSIPVIQSDAYSNMFDWRQLQRWKLDEQRLPAASQIGFKTPSLWEAYKWYITTGVIVLLLQSGLIVGLLVSRAQRRREHKAALESEKRRRDAEEEVQRQRDDLAHALRLTTLGELSASFAHEIGQPLAAILTNAEAARRFLRADEAKEEIDDALIDIGESAKRATQIITRLRALFRKEHAERGPVAINSVIREVLTLLRTDLAKKDILVRFTPNERIPTLPGDSVQLRQVFLNLLINAEDAIVCAGPGPREIHIESSQLETGCVAIAVHDTGIGAKESELESIFNRFVTSKAQGLGMGLAISRSIVEAHGGRIWATRNEDRGLTLHIELPVAPDARLGGETKPGKHSDPTEQHRHS